MDTLKDAAIKRFDDGIAPGVENGSLDWELAQLQAELEQIYRIVVRRSPWLFEPLPQTPGAAVALLAQVKTDH